MSRARASVPHFAVLEPGLSGFEQLLPRDQRLRAMVSVVVRGDLDVATGMLNVLLEAAGITMQVGRLAHGWTLEITNARVSAAECLPSLAHLIAADGWRRIKVCEKPSCAEAFIDRTNGSSRRFCDSHRRNAGIR